MWKTNRFINHHWNTCIWLKFKKFSFKLSLLAKIGYMRIGFMWPLNILYSNMKAKSYIDDLTHTICQFSIAHVMPPHHPLLLAAWTGEIWGHSQAHALWWEGNILQISFDTCTLVVEEFYILYSCYCQHFKLFKILIFS